MAISQGISLNSSDIISLKNDIRAEMARRQYNTSLASYDVDFTDSAASGNLVKKSHYEQTVGHLDLISAGAITTLSGNPKIDSIASASERVTGYANEGIEDSSSSCHAACTGLCTSCTTGCRGSCSASCADNCNNGCKGGCQNSCNTTCTGSCTGGCTGGCQGSCKDQCEDHCAVSCFGGCKGGCGVACASDCTSACNDNCVGGCGSSCAPYTCGSGCSGVCRGPGDSY